LEPSQEVQEMLDTIHQIVQREKAKQHRKAQAKKICKSVIFPCVMISLAILFSPPLLGASMSKEWACVAYYTIAFICIGYIIITDSIRTLKENENENY
jgi:hypothetical protein